MNIPEEVIIGKIHYLWEEKVMLDSDLATLYGVETKALKQAVKRNSDIFPNHFMVELTKKEFETLRSQIVTSNVVRGGARYSSLGTWPYHFLTLHFNIIDFTSNQ